MIHLLPVLGSTVVLLMRCSALFLSPSHRTREDTGQNTSESEARACLALSLFSISLNRQRFPRSIHSTKSIAEGPKCPPLRSSTHTSRAPPNGPDLNTVTFRGHLRHKLHQPHKDVWAAGSRRRLATYKLCQDSWR